MVSTADARPCLPEPSQAMTAKRPSLAAAVRAFFMRYDLLEACRLAGFDGQVVDDVCAVLLAYGVVSPLQMYTVREHMDGSCDLYPVPTPAPLGGTVPLPCSMGEAVPSVLGEAPSGPTSGPFESFWVGCAKGECVFGCRCGRFDSCDDGACRHRCAAGCFLRLGLLSTSGIRPSDPGASG